MLFLRDELERKFNSFNQLQLPEDERKALQTCSAFFDNILVYGKLSTAEKATKCKFSAIKQYVKNYASCRALAECIYFFDAFKDDAKEEQASKLSKSLILTEDEKKYVVNLLQYGVSLHKVARILGYRYTDFRKILDEDIVFAKEIYSAIAAYELKLREILLLGLQKAAARGNVREAIIAIEKSNIDVDADTQKNDAQIPYENLFV